MPRSLSPTSKKPSKTVGFSPTSRKPSRTVGFLGKTKITDYEHALLVKVGQFIAKAGKTLVIVPARGTAEAVSMGMKLEGGMVTNIENGVIAHAEHTFVFADERLMTRLREANPNIDHTNTVTLLSTTLEIEMWLAAAATVLTERGLPLPSGDGND